MYLCYIDESGTADVPGTTSHYILAGLSVPIWHWRSVDRSVGAILSRYDLADQEFHTAWVLRSYREQSTIADFQSLSYAQRRAAAMRERNAHLLRLQAAGQGGAYRQAKKTYAHSNAYVHLTLTERKTLACEIADCIAVAGSTRLFAECVDKLYFDPTRTGRSVDEQAFEQIVSRFEQYIKSTDEPEQYPKFGILVHDNNQTVAKRHTELMRRFHKRGTLWTTVDRIIETPLFVDSGLTRMVQIADLCAYALRRYLENQETDLFDRIFPRAHRVQNRVVGVRHYTGLNCTCEICRAHRPATQPAVAP